MAGPLLPLPFLMVRPFKKKLLIQFTCYHVTKSNGGESYKRIVHTVSVVPSLKCRDQNTFQITFLLGNLKFFFIFANSF